MGGARLERATSCLLRFAASNALSPKPERQKPLLLQLRQRPWQRVLELQGVRRAAQGQDLSNVCLTRHDDYEFLLAPRHAPGEVEQQSDARAVQIVDLGEVDHEAHRLVGNRMRDRHLQLGGVRQVDLALDAGNRYSVFLIELQLCEPAHS